MADHCGKLIASGYCSRRVCVRKRCTKSLVVSLVRLGSSHLTHVWQEASCLQVWDVGSTDVKTVAFIFAGQSLKIDAILATLSRNEIPGTPKTRLNPGTPIPASLPGTPGTSGSTTNTKFTPTRTFEAESPELQVSVWHDIHISLQFRRSRGLRSTRKDAVVKQQKCQNWWGKEAGKRGCNEGMVTDPLPAPNWCLLCHCPGPTGFVPLLPPWASLARLSSSSVR